MWPGEIGDEAFTDKKGIDSVEQEHIKTIYVVTTG